MSQNQGSATMKKLVMFGATGMTGLCALKHAVDRGFVVRVFLRDTKTLPQEFIGKVEIFEGNVTDYSKVEEAIQGQEGVVVVLGTRNKLDATLELSQGMTNIVRAMKKNRVDKVSVCLSAFLFYDPAKVPNVYKNINEEHKRMFEAIKDSGLNWIAVQPPHITETPSENYTIKHDESPGRSVSKFDLGRFLVDSLEQSGHYQKVCGIATL